MKVEHGHEIGPSKAGAFAVRLSPALGAVHEKKYSHLRNRIRPA
jgi:hypothetical protein